MSSKEVLKWLSGLNGKMGILFGLFAMILALIVVIKIYFFPKNVTEDDITSPRTLAAMKVCKEVPVPDDFDLLEKNWIDRVGGAAGYQSLYKTTMPFDAIHEYYLNNLPERGFSGGNWSDYVRERQIIYGKGEIRVMIAYKTGSLGLWELIKPHLGIDTWTVYIDCEKT